MTLSRRDFLLMSGSTLAYGRRHGIPSPSGSILPAVWIELNFDNLIWNLGRLRKFLRVPIIGVIKANAYGHGLTAIGRRLAESGIEGLMVCLLEEAVALRESGVTCGIYNFGPYVDAHAEILIRHRITPFLSGENVTKLNTAAISQGRQMDVHVHVDTGMNRMGIPAAQALPYLREIDALAGIRIKGISSTLTEDNDFDPVQSERLQEISLRAEKEGIDVGLRHIASSAGILESPRFHLDMVRPGILIYGYYPNRETAEEDRLALRPVLSWKTRIAQLKTLKPGDTVSYHRRYRASQEEKIAILPVGYSEGLPPSLSRDAGVLIGGTLCPIIVSSTANHTTVRIPEGTAPRIGDEAVLVGSQGARKITADDLADWSGRSNYKILIGLNPQMRRISMLKS